MCNLHINSQSHLQSLLLSTRGGGSVVGLLCEHRHQINLIASEDLLLNEGIVSLLWITSYIASLKI